jgi:hypothetical protein
MFFFKTACFLFLRLTQRPPIKNISVWQTPQHFKVSAGEPSENGITAAGSLAIHHLPLFFVVHLLPPQSSECVKKPSFFATLNQALCTCIYYIVIFLQLERLHIYLLKSLAHFFV